ncbi:MAG: NAD-glutamate dehydrogenase, partial [Deferribacterota bacterium]|nr:NAD-glutamate dehydrogenase [Deferribacterota bacterium]
PRVIRYDDFDPYLVVAADKGTGAFSDIANNISEIYNFWLKDAFASGGSNGYDHKKLGITARGAWESVKRHFLELGIDINRDNFTAVGIGDMSGDVFGNGMLLSNKIKLLAAFNHKHIFIDPKPDPEISYNERARLFKLPKSSWDDYNKDLISTGGGVFRRDAKKIQLTNEIQDILDTKESFVSGEKLITLILKMNVDLLYNGGIGTYVKDQTENNSDVGDPNNDNVRINANELRAKVVCEGGNLGFTQKARITYAINGGKINTDALDNSAGVDTSDHEVNIKILLNNLVEHSIIDENRKNGLIQEITDEVVKSVLNNNYEQNLSVSLDLERAKNNYLDFTNTANFLSEKGVLDLKESNILFCQENRTPVRPELATLLGFSKIYLYNEILSELDLKDPLIQKLYIEYFPNKLRDDFADKLLEHQLSKNIAAIMLINFMLNRIGLSCIFNLFNLNKYSYFTLLYNYYRAFAKLNLDNLWSYIESSDNIALSTKYELLIFISNSIKEVVDYSNYNALFNNFNQFKDILNRLSDNSYKNFLNTFRYQDMPNFPKEQLELLESLFHVEAALDIFQIIIGNKASQEVVINTYSLITEFFNINILKTLISKLSAKNAFEYENIMLLRYKLKELHRLLTTKFLGKAKDEIENILEKKYPYYKTLQKEIDCLIEEKADKLSAYYNLIDKLYLSFKG